MSGLSIVLLAALASTCSAYFAPPSGALAIRAQMSSPSRQVATERAASAASRRRDVTMQAAGGGDNNKKTEELV